jgi:hypothetical protein
MSNSTKPGLITLIGSGETTRYGGQVFERLAKCYPHGSRLAILETPAGFEMNSPVVAGRIADFLIIAIEKLQNRGAYDPGAQTR